jgi:uncharacterized protein (TIGR00251 family)
MTETSLNARETALGLELPIHVQPRAKRSEISGIHNGALKVKVFAPPVDDAANRAVIELLAASLHTPKSCMSITAGSRSRNKTLLIKGMSLKRFLDLTKL